MSDSTGVNTVVKFGVYLVIGTIYDSLSCGLPIFFSWIMCLLFWLNFVLFLC